MLPVRRVGVESAALQVEWRLEFAIASFCATRSAPNRCTLLYCCFGSKRCTRIVLRCVFRTRAGAGPMGNFQNWGAGRARAALISRNEVYCALTLRCVKCSHPPAARRRGAVFSGTSAYALHCTAISGRQKRSKNPIRKYCTRVATAASCAERCCARKRSDSIRNETKRRRKYLSPERIAC